MAMSSSPHDMATSIGLQTVMDELQLLVEYRAIATGYIDRVISGDVPSTIYYEFDGGSVEQFLTESFRRRLRQAGMDIRGHISVDGHVLRVYARACYEDGSPRFGELIVTGVRYARVRVSDIQVAVTDECSNCGTILRSSATSSVVPQCGHGICRLCWHSFVDENANWSMQRLVWEYVRSGRAHCLSPRLLEQRLSVHLSVEYLFVWCSTCRTPQRYNAITYVVRATNRLNMTPDRFLRIMGLSEEEVVNHGMLLEVYSRLVAAHQSVSI